MTIGLRSSVPASTPAIPGGVPVVRKGEGRSSLISASSCTDTSAATSTVADGGRYPTVQAPTSNVPAGTRTFATPHSSVDPRCGPTRTNAPSMGWRLSFSITVTASVCCGGFTTAKVNVAGPLRLCRGGLFSGSREGRGGERLLPGDEGDRPSGQGSHPEIQRARTVRTMSAPISTSGGIGFSCPRSLDMMKCYAPICLMRVGASAALELGVL